jgi:hypothetical protein
MLVPSSFQRLPNVVGCYNGQPLFGGAVSQMASALAQLQRSKFLGEAHYQLLISEQGPNLSSSFDHPIHRCKL